MHFAATATVTVFDSAILGAEISIAGIVWVKLKLSCTSSCIANTEIVIVEISIAEMLNAAMSIAKIFDVDISIAKI